MVCATYATVTQVSLEEGIKLRDNLSGTEIPSRVRGEAAFELKVGDEGLFLGMLLPQGLFEVRRLDKRKMLDPMFEKDLFGASGRFTLIEPLDNPFTDAFLRYLDQPYEDSNARRLIEEREAGDGQSSAPGTLPATATSHSQKA